MIVSPSKAEDIRWRTELLREMRADLMEGRVITAREIGKVTSWLENRINTRDYSADDARLGRLNSYPLPGLYPLAKARGARYSNHVSITNTNMNDEYPVLAGDSAEDFTPEVNGVPMEGDSNSEEETVEMPVPSQD